MWSRGELGQAETCWASLHSSITVSDCKEDFPKIMTTASFRLPSLMQVSPLANSSQLPRGNEILAPHLTKVTMAQSGTTMVITETVAAPGMLKDVQHI